MAVYEETINLGGNISTEAKAAAEKMTALQSAMDATEKAMTLAAATSGVMSKQYLQLGQKAEAYRLAAEQIPKALLDEAAATTKAAEAAKSLTAAHSKTATKTTTATTATNDLATAQQGATGSSAGMQAELAELTGGLSLVVEAIGALVVGFGVAVVAGAAFAIKCSEAKTQMIAMFDALGEGKIKGEQVDDMLDGLRAKLGVTKDSMVPLVKEFMSMGVTSQEALEKMTTAAMSAKALTGGSDEAAKKFTELAAKIKLAADTGQKMKNPLKDLKALGLTVDDVAAKMGGADVKKMAAQIKAGTVDAKAFGDALQNALIEKGAGPLETMGLSVSNLGGMVKEYLGDLFEDMGTSIKPFLLAVKDLFGILDSKAKPSGQALKSGIEGFFKQVFVYAAKVVPYIKHFLLDVVIYGLKAYIALKPIIAWFKQLAANQTVIDGILFALKAIGVVVLVVVGVIVALVAIAMICNAAFMALVIGVIWLGQKFGEFIAGAGAALYGWVKGAATAAYDFVAGLVSGIAKGAGMVIDAVKGLAGSALGAFKGALGISSPSKIMMQMGGHVASGAAEGIDSGAPEVHAASAGLAGAAAGGFGSGGGGGAAAASGGGSTFNNTFNFSIDGGGKTAMEITEEMLALAFERMALGAGA